ncbi:MAG: CheR family methyltransferase [Terriglobia bacterium]|jgi:chemotaxis protein methyltransferase WspC
MNLAAAVTRLLSERLGLSGELLGFVVVERALDIVIGKAGSVDRAERIAHLLRGQGEEWEMLVDEVVVPETWFFRDRKPFQFLASYVTEKWRPANPTGPFKVLCIPCASGEEPYSVAMTLLDAGLEADRIRIDAGEISERALASARRGVYRKSSFREKSNYLGEQYLLRHPEGRRVREDVAALVRFEKANLLDLSVYRQRAPYVAMFCRNALIYFEERVRREVIASLRDLLVDDGLLFTGHSELMPFLEAGYQRVDYPQSFACRKARPAHVAPVPRAAGPARAVPPCGSGATPPETEGLQSIFARCQIATEAAATIHRARKQRRIAPAYTHKALKAPQAAPPPVSIEEAGQLADRGKLEAATAICERLLAEGTQDPNVYSLLGVLSESGGKLETAEDLFRKALFLDPHHYQSLLHMGLLCERHGDIDGSRLYRARASRVLSRQGGGREA